MSQRRLSATNRTTLCGFCTYVTRKLDVHFVDPAPVTRLPNASPTWRLLRRSIWRGTCGTQDWFAVCPYRAYSFGQTAFYLTGRREALVAHSKQCSINTRVGQDGDGDAWQSPRDLSPSGRATPWLVGRCAWRGNRNGAVCNRHDGRPWRGGVGLGETLPVVAGQKRLPEGSRRKV